MKRQIFGRRTGSGAEFKLMIESEGATSGGNTVSFDQMRDFEIANTRRAVQALREKSVEGYVLFEGDPTHYLFTPSNDFVYPVVQE